MAKLSKTTFVCQNCGAVSPRWQGKCPSCGEWNTLTEETDAVAPPGTGLSRRGSGRVIVLEGLKGSTQEAPRFSTGIGELDRVTGGGIVPGSALLIGGEPGIGKSTLLLQLAATLARAGRRAVYFSGEEAAAQVRLRAERLGLSDAPVALACETSLAHILATLEAGPPPDLIVIDSIQTLWAEAIEAAPGTVSQVRAAAQALIRHAKTAGSALLLVGHVTKDGQIAGPKVIEHMVDTVLYFEGDRGHTYRILRAVKNRFGATDEIGVFEMVIGRTARGRQSVRAVPRRPRKHRARAPPCSPASRARGRCWSKSRRWSRPPRSARRGAPSSGGIRAGCRCCSRCWKRAPASRSPGRTSTSTSPAACRINEPAADLAAAAALVSSLSGVAIPRHRVHFGEVSLSGAINATPLMGPRLKEAQKLGFRQALLPAQGELETAGIEAESYAASPT